MLTVPLPLPLPGDQLTAPLRLYRICHLWPLLHGHGHGRGRGHGRGAGAAAL